jgi:DNA repair exonuclease SbcCD ATPase subunit
MSDAEVAEEVIETEGSEVEGVGGEEEAKEAEETTEDNPEGGGDDTGDDSDDLVVSIGEGDSPTLEEDDPSLPGHLRGEIKKRNEKLREKDEALNELRRELASLRGTTGAQEVPAPGPKPSPDDFLDVAEYAAASEAWQEKNTAYQSAIASKREAEEKQTQEWQKTLDTHKEKAAEIKAKVKNYDEAEAMVQSALDKLQFGAIVHCGTNSALLMAALGSNPAELERMAAIKDPSKFIFELGKMETKVKTGKRRATTTPEKRVTGTAPLSSGTDKVLEKLEKEADKTGDRTKVVAYKRELKKKKKE